VVRRALRELGVPSIPLKFGRGVDTGWPDQLFLIPGGRPLFIELKDVKGEVEPKQNYKHTLLKDLGYDVIVCNTPESALYRIAEKVVAARLPEARRQVVTGERRSRAILGSRFGQDVYLTRCLQLLEEERDRR
jgi:hypothetical protein